MHREFRPGTLVSDGQPASLTIGYLGQTGPDAIITTLVVNGVEARTLIDTGATASFIPLRGNILSSATNRLSAANTSVKAAWGNIRSQVYSVRATGKPKDSNQASQEFTAYAFETGSDKMLTYELILGLSEIRAFGMKIDFSGGQPCVQPRQAPSIVTSVTPQ